MHEHDSGHMPAYLKRLLNLLRLQALAKMLVRVPVRLLAAAATVANLHKAMR